MSRWTNKQLAAFAESPEGAEAITHWIGGRRLFAVHTVKNSEQGIDDLAGFIMDNGTMADVRYLIAALVLR